MKKAFLLTVMLLTGLLGFAQKIKVEWVSGDVTIFKKGSSVTSKVKNNETIDLGDRVFVGDKALLVVSDYSKKLFEVKKKGYVTGKELSEGLLKTTDNEYQRYIAYILKELKSHEGDMKSGSKGIPGAPSRGNEFQLTIPDTMILFENEPLPVRWTNGNTTENVNIRLMTDKKTELLDFDVNGNTFWFNNISTFFLVKKSLILTLYERRSDGQKIMRTQTVIKQSDLKEADIEKQFDQEFKEIADPRLNLIAKATKWEINHYYLKALDIYKVLMLDYPDDEVVKISFSAFSQRTGLY